MEINPMMYRVFLQEEDIGEPGKRKEKQFRIRSGELLAWKYITGNYTPTLESQLNSAHDVFVINASDPIDEHYIIMQHFSSIGASLPIGVVHSIEEIPIKAYELAKRAAINLKNSLIREKGKEYIFIDLTSQDDKNSAQELSTKIENVPIPPYSGKC